MDKGEDSEQEPFLASDDVPTPHRDFNQTTELMFPTKRESPVPMRETNRPRRIETDLGSSFRGSNRPDTKTPLSRQALKDRLSQRKNMKEENDPNSPVAIKSEDFKQANEKRMALLKRRQQARELAHPDDEEVEEKDDDDDVQLDAKQAAAKDKKNAQTKKLEEDESKHVLITTMLPPHIYPLTVLPTWRSNEAKEHPVLSIPAPHPHTSKIFSDCFGKLTQSCSGNTFYPHYEELEWGDDEDELGAVLTASVRNPDSLMPTSNRSNQNSSTNTPFIVTERLLKGELLSTTNPSRDAISIDNVYESAAEVELSASYQEEEGLFIGRRPLLTSQLMDGEEVGLQIATMVAKDLYLSRITQRILRDLCGSEKMSSNRKFWTAITNEHTDPKERKLHEGSMSLLRIVNTLNGRGPVLRIYEDPVDEAVYEPIADIGGLNESWKKTEQQKRDMHDMQFGALSTKSEILGHIPAWGGQRSGRRRRGVLRVHVQTLSFTKHLLMNEEELKFIELKKIYAKYRVLFEQQATGYLVYRLHALLEELSRITYSLPAENAPGEQLTAAKAALADVLETLPSLADLRSGLGKISGSLYKCWMELKEIRNRQRFVSTRAVLVGRPLYFLDELGTVHKKKEPSAEEADDSAFYPHLEAEVEHWNVMRELLQDLPDIVVDLCTKLKSNLDKKLPSTDKVVVDGRESPKHGDSKDSNDEYGNEFMKSISALVKQSVSDLSGPFLPLMVYRLTSLGQVTQDPHGDRTNVNNSIDGTKQVNKDLLVALDPAEEQRRLNVSSMSVKLVLKVNGRTMTTTDPCPLQWPQYSANVLRSFEFRVYNHLNSVTVDIILCTKGFFGLSEQLVGTVPIPLPYISNQDVGAQNTAPVAGWCSFTSAQPTVVKKSQAEIEFRAEGFLLCGSEYEIFAENTNPSRLDGVKINQLSHFNAARRTSDNGASNRAMLSSAIDFTRERDFQRMLPEFDNLDPNDPQNEHVLQLKKLFTSGNQASRDTFVLVGGRTAAVSYSENGASYSNFLKSKVPDRIRLLMMRESRPYLFTEPIPLSDAIIQKSEYYRSLLAAVNDETPPTIPVAEATLIAGREQLETIEETEGAAEEYGEGVGIPVQKISTFLQRVRDSHTAVSRQSKIKKIATNSVVSEPIQLLPTEFSFSSLFKIAEAFEGKRALKPKPYERKPPSSIVNSCDLLIQVVGAKNIPLRDVQHVGERPARRPVARGSKLNRQPSSFDYDDNDDGESVATGMDYSSATSAVAGMSRAGNRFGGMQRAQTGLDLLDKKKVNEKQRARTFVEIRFQDSTYCTTSVEGAAPMWKQSLSLPIHPPHDNFSPQTMESIQDNIYFTLFDEVIEDDSGRGGYFEDESTERIERRYLGSLNIPFATLFNQGRVDGVFRLDVPVYSFGYLTGVEKKLREASLGIKQVPGAHPEYQQPQIGFLASVFGGPTRPVANADTSHAAWDVTVDEATEVEFDNFASGSGATFIKLLITLDPLLAPIVVPGVELTPSTVSPQDRFLVSYAHKWLSQLKSKTLTEKRDYKLFGSSSDGYKTFICRYLTPQEPPMGISTRRGCLHLASLIPFMPDAQAFIGEFDLWCTVKQMWEMGAGDEEEHGTTLYNYLAFISTQEKGANSRTYGDYPPAEVIAKEKNFFVLGNAIPEGDSCYILSRQDGGSNAQDNKKFVLINPCSGYVYSPSDKNCPMVEVFCLATPYNIWANIQPSAKPCEMSFDVLDTRCWKPFFCSSFPFPKGGLTSVQETVTYVPTPMVACVQIERELKGAIKSKFRRWRSRRSRSKTTFHPDACAVIADNLYMLEEWKMTGEMPSLGKSNETGKDNVPAYYTQRTKMALPPAAKGKSVTYNNDGVPEHVLSALQAEIRSKLKNVLKTRQLFGYPINLAFTDVNMVLDRIKSMCVHETKHPEAQFVLAVKAFPLVNNIVSLWIFLGTLEDIPPSA